MQLPTLIIDSDPITYMAAFASQTSVYEYVYETKSGELKQRIWGDGRKARAFFRRYPDCTILSSEKRTEGKPAAFAMQAAKTIITRTIAKVLKKLEIHNVNDLHIEVLLSGQNNFRKDIATIKGYKSDRTAELPIHYQVVRNYLTDTWGAEVIDGWEADDEVSIRARKLAEDGVEFCIATIDKDLDQIPGLHYDYRQHVFYDIDEEYAETFFWEQVLSGDSTDSIQGCYKIGAATAKKLIAEYSDDWERRTLTAEETLNELLWRLICGKYAQVMETYPDKYPEGMTWTEAALETARLVYMMQYENELWVPPGEDKETLDGRVTR